MTDRHALWVAMIQQTTANLPALVAHRVSNIECGHRENDLHDAQWQIVVPGQDNLRMIRLCDRHFALFVLDRERYEQLEIPLDYEGEDGA